MQYATGYKWSILVDLAYDNNPLIIDDSSVVKFVPVTTTNKPQPSTAPITVSFLAAGDAHAVGRIVCEIVDTSNISPVPHRLEITVIVGGVPTGPYYSEVFDVVTGYAPL